MNYDEHGPHDFPLLFITDVAPRYAALCEPHSVPGRWGEKVYITEPVEPDAVSLARRVVAGLVPEPNLATGDRVNYWETRMRAELALSVLSAAVSRVPSFECQIVFDAKLDHETEAFVRSHLTANAQLVRMGAEAIVTTAVFADVRFLLGHEMWETLCANLTAIIRAGEHVAIVFYLFDEERFYFIDPDGTIENDIRSSAAEFGLTVIDGDAYSFVAGGALEHCVELEKWVAGGAKGLPPLESEA